ncbi:hypothetical protein NECID01_1073 [Nematocida sp. AWRm77]|nr:hypothetical protein NECID01_1073 [Nematocida sp. AWRm77]
MAKIVIVHNVFLIAWACPVLVCGTDVNNCAFEPISYVEMMWAGINSDNFCSNYSAIPDFIARDTLPNEVQENPTLGDFGSLDTLAPSNAVNTVNANENFSLSLPGTSTGTGSSISSVQVQSTAGNATKRINEETERTDGEQKTHKRQKKQTTGSKANTSLIDEAEARLIIEDFNKQFGDAAKVIFHLSVYMAKFAKDLAQRALTSAHSSKIVEQCMASEKWRGHNVFWRILMFFLDTQSLEIVSLNQLENKTNIVLRNRKKDSKSLSEYSYGSINNIINDSRNAKRIEIKCSLSFLERRSTTDIYSVLRWLLYHVKIERVGITCDLTEAGMNSKIFGKQIAVLTKEWRESRVCIDSLTLRFAHAQHMTAAEIVKECPRIPVLKIHFISVDLCQSDAIQQTLKKVLLHCPALKHLSVFGVGIGIEHIHTIVKLLPQMVFLEVEFLFYYKKEWLQRKESPPVFPGLSALKLHTIHSCPSSIENLVCLFPSLQRIQLASKNAKTHLIDALSNLPHLRSLGIINGFLPIETIECLLGKLSSLEYLSVGVKELDCKLAHALSKYAGMHTLMLRGSYIPGFLASLLQPSPLMSTLEFLDVCRYCITRKSRLTPEDKHSKTAAMKNFGCKIQMSRG